MTTRSRVTAPQGSIRTWSESAAFVVAAFYVFTIPWENTVVVPSIGTASRAAGFLLIFAWLIMQALGPQFRHFRLPHALVFALVLWICLSALWSIDVPAALIQLRTFLQLFMSLVILWSILNTKHRVRWGLQAFVFGAVVVAGGVFYNQFLGNVQTYSGRATIAGVDQNDIALVLAMALPMALYLGTSTRNKWHSVLSTVFNLMYIPAGYVAIIMTGSRGGTLSTLPFLIYALYLSLNSRARGVLGLAILVPATIAVIINFAPEAPLQRIGETYEQVDAGDMSGRGEIWNAGYQAWLAGGFNSVIGFGSGTYRAIVGRGAHNTPLSVLVELGIVGLVLFFGVVATLIRESWRADPKIRGLCLALLACWAIGTLSLTWEYRKPTWVLWSLVLCTAVSYSQNEAKSGNHRRRSRKRRKTKLGVDKSRTTRIKGRPC